MARHKRIAQVGHLERFNPAVRATLPLLTQPMFFEVHRLSVFTPRSLDVDVVLDLMIHDLDIVLSFANSPVKEVRAVGLPDSFREGRHRQCADGARIRLRGQLHGQPRFHRTGPQAALLPAAAIHFARLRTPGSAGLHGWRMESRRALPSPILRSEWPNLRSLRKSLCTRSSSRFCARCASVRHPAVPLEDGRRALALALEHRAAIRDHGRKVDLASIAKGKA